MNLFQENPESLAEGVPPWLSEAFFWIAIVLVFVALAAALGIWVLVLRMRDLQRESARLAVLDELKLLVKKIVADRDDLDLRRLEHVLIDLRDTQKRLEDALLRSIESAQKADQDGSSALVPHSQMESLGERVINRLLAMGYARVHVVTRPEKIAELAQKDGEVLVEARREGVLHKGRVLVRGGRLADVEIHPSYSIFP